MSSFPAQAARVRDLDLPLERRLLALRECALHFAPYEFRKTWHYLIAAARVPVWLEIDPDALLRALDLLEPARNRWLAETRSYAARRRLEKAAGRRQPRAGPPPHPPAPEPWPDDGRPWALIWYRMVPRDETIGGGDIEEFRAEYTPTSADGRFGDYQLYIRGVPLGNITTTALAPHVVNLRAIRRTAEDPAPRDPEPLILGDTFDHVHVTLAATEHDLIFEFASNRRPGWAPPPQWTPPRDRPRRLLVRRTEVITACRAAEARFEAFLGLP
ncbi:hypothetical protein Aab01nite_33700 [Paractinoplanes abujensis]|uniref:Uncharacterized protein n=1 Tax=Paractinoplanes abujensis TaxID=882441 RepID=A0A7W7G4U8_9ACTN|nr:hypothetical protein [Actinoplanes abujensis]MBB4697733.1 hypothetical protein [Actinoplanes abujensis]GID19780.1 hypothetical protein Aab01nite_33700 [Actinoplanes abujensis]